MSLNSVSRALKPRSPDAAAVATDAPRRAVDGDDHDGRADGVEDAPAVVLEPLARSGS